MSPLPLENARRRVPLDRADLRTGIARGWFARHKRSLLATIFWKLRPDHGKTIGQEQLHWQSRVSRNIATCGNQATRQPSGQGPISGQGYLSQAILTSAHIPRFLFFHHFPIRAFHKSTKCRQSTVFLSYIAGFPSFGRVFDPRRPYQHLLF